MSHTIEIGKHTGLYTKLSGILAKLVSTQDEDCGAGEADQLVDEVIHEMSALLDIGCTCANVPATPEQLDANGHTRECPLHTSGEASI